jgi:hypothetical protein
MLTYVKVLSQLALNVGFHYSKPNCDYKRYKLSKLLSLFFGF